MRYIIIILGTWMFISCNSTEQKSSPKDQFDALEKIFSNDNWKVTGGTDTSYLYFSRLGDLSFKVYDYILKEGDSSINEINDIVVINDQLNWLRNADTLILASVDSVTASWDGSKGEKALYTFRKDSDSTVSFQMNGREFFMTKTLNLTTFLVRSKYDYLNNTHTIDSPLVAPRGGPLSN